MHVYFKSLVDHVCYTIHTERADQEANEGMVMNTISQHSLCLCFPSPLLSCGRGCNSRLNSSHAHLLSNFFFFLQSFIARLLFQTERWGWQPNLLPVLTLGGYQYVICSGIVFLDFTLVSPVHAILSSVLEQTPFLSPLPLQTVINHERHLLTNSLGFPQQLPTPKRRSVSNSSWNVNADPLLNEETW